MRKRLLIVLIPAFLIACAVAGYVLLPLLIFQ